MNSLLFENLQLMHESKFNRKIMKEDRDNLSVSEYNKLKMVRYYLITYYNSLRKEKLKMK